MNVLLVSDWAKAIPRFRRQGRLISVSAVPLDAGTEIWRTCRHVGASLRALHGLPEGIGRFLPCRAGANHCLHHTGWEPRSGKQWRNPLLDELLRLFGFRAGVGSDLLRRELKLGLGIARLPLRMKYPLGLCLGLGVRPLESQVGLRMLVRVWLMAVCLVMGLLGGGCKVLEVSGR